MKLFGKNLDHQGVLIAEIGVNHEGSPKKARDLLRLAAEAGADAVKFQSYTPARFISTRDPERFQQVSARALDERTHYLLAEEAAKRGVAFLSTPVTEDWIPLVARLSPVIKIASGDLTFEPIIRAAAATGKPVILSTGLGTETEIEQAIGWVREEIGDRRLKDSLALMHCVSAYPTPIEEANLRSIPFLTDRFALTVGYSNHVIGPEACWAAIALGAPIIEVHFTDEKEGRTFRDHQLSFNPNDLAGLVEAMPRLRAALGRYDKQPQPSELPGLGAMRKGVVAAADLKAGTVLGEDHIMFARPATGIESGRVAEVLGAVLTRDLVQGESLADADLNKAD
ncbi:N-acetylneuraminate synthase family protein [Magnetospira sp. QH-2]|uniref:N-acetylneuraminate synthase family protein n=1 Tax=Magnetospira sp. (strain QH-2) TaxID=1288970 RepID=UPI0003E814F8|nr:N-acetylneuraminate synthase family protein [Magnetospira sp. QH-2]CCQ73070.1 putative N-acetylneuraminate synthase [Magnetospira sp. QH-2]